jgi:hypothetical protein
MSDKGPKGAKRESVHGRLLGEAFVGDRLRSGSCAGDHREDASVTTERLGRVEQIELRNPFRVDDHVSPDFGESTSLLKLDVLPLGFIGEASSFARQGGALGLAISGRSGKGHCRECSTALRPRVPMIDSETKTTAEQYCRGEGTRAPTTDSLRDISPGPRRQARFPRA